jgi:thymidine kinase
MNTQTTVEDIKRRATSEELELYSYVTDKADSVAEEIVEMVKLGMKSGDGGMIFVYGPQNSGKTLVACLVADHLTSKKLIVSPIQPNVDRPDVPKDRYYSRSGVDLSVKSYSNKSDLEKLFSKSDVVIVDEVQFTQPELQSYFLKMVLDFVERGGWVVNIGVLYTSQASEFLLSAVLKDRAMKTFGLTATCQKCGARGATLNQRIVKGVPTSSTDPELIAPSEDVSYEPRCKDCHVIIG